jgi:hypothetical protein
VASQLGFRVGGKIVARKVDVGAVVKRAGIDAARPVDLLSRAQAKAALASAERTATWHVPS